MMYNATVAGKWIAMLKEISPGLKRAALVINPRSAPYYQYFLDLRLASRPFFVQSRTTLPISNRSSSLLHVFRMAGWSCYRTARLKSNALPSSRSRPDIDSSVMVGHHYSPFATFRARLPWRSVVFQAVIT